MIGVIIGGAFLLLVLVTLVRALALRAGAEDGGTGPSESVDRMAAAEHLSRAVQCVTLSSADPEKCDPAPFHEFLRALEEMYPLLHRHCERELINGINPLFRWPGRNSALKPGMIIAHIDVVPVEAGTEGQWAYPPFSGAIAEDFVWGRGSLDIKSHLVGALEAAEILLKKGFTPERDIYFGFGTDEEVRSTSGASRIVEHLRSRNIRLEYVLDEGGCVNRGMLSGVDRPLALVGIGEKGFANVRVSLHGGGGHASMPPKRTALGKLSKLFTDLEERQLPLRMTPPVKAMLKQLAPYMGFGPRYFIANLWLFKPLFMRVFSKTATGNAMLRTTTAVTMARGSQAANVLPPTAEGVINFRIIPGETVETVVEHIRRVAGNQHVECEVLVGDDPSRITGIDTEAYRRLKSCIRGHFPDALALPYLMMAGTDSRKYEEICDNIFRFTPYVLEPEDMERIHGTNERISLDNLERIVSFFTSFLSFS